MKKIGILYLCTGPYVAFWKDFYETAEKYFLSDYEKHYFVFCDQEVETFGEANRIHYKHIDNMPWPLITLLRYHYFMSISEQLQDMDYLMFSNANMIFTAPIAAEEMLPREDQGEEVFVVMHPGYCRSASCQAPFERNEKSTAYVPYNYKEKYVIGAMNGGTSAGFLKMSESIMQKTNEDLKKNRIARWHDESQLNHYIYENKHYRMLSPSYCYPFGFELPCEKKIIAVSKQAKFDVKALKGVSSAERSVLKKIEGKLANYTKWIVNNCMAFIDDILRK